MTDTSALTGKLVDIINQTQSVVSSHAAEATGLALKATSVDGVIWLLFLFAWFSISVFLCYIFGKDTEKSVDADTISAICGISAFLSFIFLVYPWNWIQVFDPKLYLAHQIISNFTS